MVYPNLKTEMKRRCISQVMLAGILRANPQTIRGKCNGYIQWKLPEMLKIKEFLLYRGSIEDLFKKETA